MLNKIVKNPATTISIVACCVIAALILWVIVSTQSKRSTCEERGGVYIQAYCLDVSTIDLEGGNGN